MKILKIKFAQIILLSLAITFISCEKSNMDDLETIVPLTVENNSDLPSIYINGTLIHSEAFGNPNDPMIVVIHGGPGGDYRSLLKLQKFADEGFYVVFYDQRGSGLSQRHDASENVFTTQLFINDLDAVIYHYKSYDQQQVFLVGHEWGAVLATAYINQYPDHICGLILSQPEILSDYILTNGESKKSGIIIFTDQHEIADQELITELGLNNNIPFWRYGAICKMEMNKHLEERSLNIIRNLDQFSTKVMLYQNETNVAQALEVGQVFIKSEIKEIGNCGACLPYESWNEYFINTLEYLNQIRK